MSHVLKLWSTHSELPVHSGFRHWLMCIPSLQVWHDPADEPVCEIPFDFGFEQEDSQDGMRKLIVEEVSSFRQLVRQQQYPAQAQHPS